METQDNIIIDDKDAVCDVVVDIEKHEAVQVSNVVTAVASQRDYHNKLMLSAFENKADIEVIKELVQIQVNFDMREAKKSFFSALSKFQSQIPMIPKNGVGTFIAKATGKQVSYPFPLIEDIAHAINPFLYKNGICYRFEIITAAIITVKCIVSHKDGHSVSTEMSGPPDKTGFKNDLQAIGASSKYLERYTLTAAVGVMTVGEDHDAADAGANNIDAANICVDLNQETNSYYSDDQFKNSLPRWSGRIRKGLNTKDQLVDFLNKKGMSLTKDQHQTIKNIEVEK